MESACPVILNGTNYFQWLPHMVDILRSKGIYRIATRVETRSSMRVDRNFHWSRSSISHQENKQDQARGLIGMSIAQDLRFDILDIDTPHEAFCDSLIRE